jgi:hypothetical protein
MGDCELAPPSSPRAVHDVTGSSSRSRASVGRAPVIPVHQT